MQLADRVSINLEAECSSFGAACTSQDFAPELLQPLRGSMRSAAPIHHPEAGMVIGLLQSPNSLLEAQGKAI
jgi:hypothetical protein